MEYKLTMSVNCGACDGYRRELPQETKRDATIYAENVPQAILDSIRTMRKTLTECIPNPETNYTRVKLLSLSREGKELRGVPQTSVKRRGLEKGCSWFFGN